MKIDKKISDNILELSKIMDKNNLLEIDISDGKNSYRLKKISHQNNIIENLKDETSQKSLKKDKPDTKGLFFKISTSWNSLSLSRTGLKSIY